MYNLFTALTTAQLRRYIFRNESSGTLRDWLMNKSIHVIGWKNVVTSEEPHNIQSRYSTERVSFRSILRNGTARTMGAQRQANVTKVKTSDC